jgi:hypothetical protein
MLVEALIVASLLTAAKKWALCIHGDAKLKDKIGSEFAPHDPKLLSLPSKH